MNDNFKTALLMDIDGTLTDPRKPLQKEMAEALSKLNIPFFVAAGSHLHLIELQFFKPLWEFGFRYDFEAFLSNGAAHYRCNFSLSYDIELLYEFDFKKYLGEEKYKHLLSVLDEVLTMEQYKLQPSMKVIGEQINDRISMVNCTPIGRPKEPIISEEAYANRKAFEEFDKTTNYRSRVISFLEMKLSNIIEEKNLIVMLGGKTSFDICIKGKDKTNAVRKLLKDGYEKVIFLGDALDGSGNDSVIRLYIENWKDTKPCPLSAQQVSGWRDTIEKLKSNGWISI